jgi:hypothetical protein
MKNYMNIYCVGTFFFIFLFTFSKASKYHSCLRFYHYVYVCFDPSSFPPASVFFTFLFSFS